MRLRNQPVPRHRDAVTRRRLGIDVFSHVVEIQRPRERRQHDELRERQIGAFGERCRGVECVGAIARQAEDERAEHVDAVLAERPQPLDQRVADGVEILVDVLQAFRA